ncbi:MAG TPA: type VII secretion protein EccCa [Candidatus Dormibacteraeota bacterium]|nr:type VII secretion protein EccCa [Candidatus Dormibacteraeota bacterium]
MTITPPRAPAPATSREAVLRRPPRTPPPPVPSGEVRVPPPPSLPLSQGGPLTWMQYALPAVGSLGAILFVLINPRPLYVAASVLFALSSVAMGAGMYLQQRSSQRRTITDQRHRYMVELEILRRAAVDTAVRQHRAAAWRHPEPEQLWALACSRARAWERRRDDADFLAARLGRGRRPLATPLRLDVASSAGVDQLALAEAQRLVARHAEVEDLPITVDLARGGLVEVGGGERSRALLRAVVAELVTLHAPDDLVVAICAGPETAPSWEWTKWLPHLRHPDAVDDVGPLRLIAPDAAELVSLLERELVGRRQTGGGAAGARPPHLVLVVDGGHGSQALLDLAMLPAVTVIALADAAPAGGGTRIHVDTAGRLEVAGPALGDGGTAAGRADGASVAVSTALARRLAPLRLSAEERSAVTAAGIDLPGLLGVADPSRLDPGAMWAPRPVEELLRIPIGLGADGKPLVLDLKESAFGGMGPHGLVVGATGAGKSELLRTLVTGLALTHPPGLLSLVLVDFKGGATFADLADLPHVAGMITNLGADLALVDRVKDALFGEQNRRQELLRRAGNLAGIREYRERRAQRPELEPMPYLLVVVDEFGQLLGARPDFLDLFVAVGRLGRSLGMHLLLASQQLDEGRLRGLETHVSYRVCLRTFSAAESRVVLGVPDAYHLPPLPGSAYLKVGTETFERFRAALVSAPLRRRTEDAPARSTPLLPFTAAPVHSPGTGAPPAAPGDEPVGEVTVMGAVVERLRYAAPPVHQVWLPPLEPLITLDQVLPGVALEGPAAAMRWAGAGRLSAPLGLVDRPLEQTREVLTVDLAGGEGHLAVVGAPQTGKSTLLRTLVLALALTHSPRDLWVHAVDYGGGGLAQLAGLPHVGTVCGRADPERVCRLVAHVASLLEEREQLFRLRAIDSPATLRTARAAGAVPPELGADVVLVVDNWPGLRLDHEDLEPLIADIAARGLGYGVHLVLSAGRWIDIRGNLRESIGGRLELRLNDPTESYVDRRASAALPAGVPGRGLAADGHLVQVALPRIDGLPRRDDLGSATEAAVTAAAALWPDDVAAAPVRVLPARLLVDHLPRPGQDRERGVPVGVAEPALDPLYVDVLGEEPHLVVWGDGGSGKTSLLRTYLAGLCARHRPDQVSVLLVDSRMRLREVVPRAHVFADAPTAPAALEAVQRLRQLAESRLPTADLDARELRNRSWWSGPDVVVVVDDYDLVSTPSLNPLLPLVDVLAQGRDLGVHLVVTRRVGGAARALFEPPLQRLRELGAPGIILSGERQEGALVGPFSAAPRPPGRGLCVRRGRRPALVQIALLPEDATEG